MPLIEDGRLYPCNQDGAWRQESEMMSAWVEEPEHPQHARRLAQWRRLVIRRRDGRIWLGYTRSPRCMAG